MTVKKRDIFRIKEELEVPQNYPNISRMIWQGVETENVEFRALEGHFRAHFKGNQRLYAQLPGIYQPYRNVFQIPFHIGAIPALYPFRINLFFKRQTAIHARETENVEFRALEGKISVQGDLNVFPLLPAAPEPRCEEFVR